MVRGWLVLAHVVGQLESFVTATAGIGEPTGKQICESEAFQGDGQQTDGAGSAADVDRAGMKVRAARSSPR